jgi:hypothetical protein
VSTASLGASMVVVIVVGDWRSPSIVSLDADMLVAVVFRHVVVLENLV